MMAAPSLLRRGAMASGAQQTTIPLETRMANSLAVYELSAAISSVGAQITWYEPSDVSPIFMPGSDGWVTRTNDNGGKPGLRVSKPGGSNALSTAIDIQVRAANSSNYLKLCGIVIRRQGNSGNPQGKDTFPSCVISPDHKTLTLNDNDNVKTSYEFDLLFQDDAGNYGLVDPKISNV